MSMLTVWLTGRVVQRAHVLLTSFPSRIVLHVVSSYVVSFAVLLFLRTGTINLSRRLLKSADTFFFFFKSCS